MNSKKQCFLFLLAACIVSVCADNGDTSSTNSTNATTTTVTMKTIDEVYLDLRKNKTTKDADLVIKMTADFIRDMQQKMHVIKRVEKSYSTSAEYTQGSVFSDIQRRFTHMCDLYKQFATVRRYVYGEDLNTTTYPSPDVIVVFQIMVSDYNEILMMMELFRVEQTGWKEGIARGKTRDLINKQMMKFGNLPAKLTPPAIVELGPTKDMATGKAPEGGSQHEAGRGWRRGRGPDYAQAWSGELDGVALDER